MDNTYTDVNETDAPDIGFDVVEFNAEFTILKDRSDKSSSSVWKHFGVIIYRGAVDKKHVYCLHCFDHRKIKKYQTTTSTGNLSKHLQVHHKISLNEAFRVKKEHDNSIHLIGRETDESDKGFKDLDGGSQDEGEEFLIHDINEILISEVAKRPLLFGSQTHLEGKGAKTIMRRQLWTEVYDALSHIVPLARLPTIWKNIRDRYHKVRRISNLYGSRPKYRYYDQLRFLDRVDDEAMDQHKSTDGDTAESNDRRAQAYTKSGDHDHYSLTKLITIPAEMVTYEEITYEPKVKRQKLSPAKTTNHSLDADHENIKPTLRKPATTNIIEESFANATNGNMYAQQHGNDLDIGSTDPSNQGILSQANIELITTATADATNVERAHSDEFEHFGKYVAAVLRNMPKYQSRMLQMDIMKVITEAECGHR